MLFETIGFTIDQLNGDNGGAGAIAIIALRRYLLSPIMPLGGGRHITARPTSLKLVKQTSLAIASLVVVRWSTPHRGPLATGDMRHGNYEVSIYCTTNVDATSQVVGTFVYARPVRTPRHYYGIPSQPASLQWPANSGRTHALCVSVLWPGDMSGLVTLVWLSDDAVIGRYAVVGTS